MQTTRSVLFEVATILKLVSENWLCPINNGMEFSVLKPAVSSTLFYSPEISHEEELTFLPKEWLMVTKAMMSITNKSKLPSPLHCEGVSPTGIV